MGTDWGGSEVLLGQDLFQFDNDEDMKILSKKTKESLR